MPNVPQGYEIVREPGTLPVAQVSGTGEDFAGTWEFGARFTPTGQLELGVLTAPDGLEWGERIDFVVAKRNAAKLKRLNNQVDGVLSRMAPDGKSRYLWIDDENVKFTTTELKPGPVLTSSERQGWERFDTHPS